MLTTRYRDRLWNNKLEEYFPNLDHLDCTKPNAALDTIHEKADKVRRLRNRIAHHEPIFPEPLSERYDDCISLIRARCCHTAEWVDRVQQVTGLLEKRPDVPVRRRKNGTAPKDGPAC